MPVLRKDSSSEFVRSLLGAVRERGDTSQRRCGLCGKQMSRFSIDTPAGAVDLEYCGRCNMVWFEPNEYSLVPHPVAQASEELSPRPRQPWRCTRSSRRRMTTRGLTAKPE